MYSSDYIIFVDFGDLLANLNVLWLAQGLDPCNKTQFFVYLHYSTVFNVRLKELD